MARFARLVVPGYPHHITQRGVRSMDIFAGDDDRRAYLTFMAEEAERFGVTFLAWCLMSNHVHLIAQPEGNDSLARAIGEAHRRYTRMKNFAEGVRGYLFQGRFGSCVLDQQHLLAAGRYVERNPVKARLVQVASEYMWSSCRYHCGLIENDPLVRTRRLPEMVGDWPEFVRGWDDEAEKRFLTGTRTGRPVGDDGFVDQLEKMAGRILRPQPAGRPCGGRK
jgi:putative transposase